MQCNHMNEIYSVDKKLIKKLGDEFQRTKKLRNITNKIIKAGNGHWERGVDEYFTSKKWVFFNTKPFKGEQRLLFETGWYKHNKVGCGQCEICRTEKSKAWAVKATCEYKTWKNACFLTLTYNEPNLQVNNGFINKADMQTFWKKLRYHLYKDTKESRKIDMKQEFKNMEEMPEQVKLKYLIAKRKPKNKPLRYIQCNEYGEKKGRPHAHAVVFNFKPTDLRRHSRDRRGYYLYTSKKINSIWGHGYVIIADVNANVSAYVARYNTKKFSNTSGIVNETIQALYKAYMNAEGKIKDRFEHYLKVWKRRRESICASSLGYIGSYYWEIAKEKIIRDSGIFVNWAKGVRLEKMPKPMEKQYEAEYPMEFDWYEYEKEKVSKEQWEKILSQTTLTESEYIEMTFNERMKKLKRLKREYSTKPTMQTLA